MFHFTPPTNTQLTKQNILTTTNGGQDVFRNYIPDFEQEGKAFKAVFRQDNHPSANVFCSESGEYLYKDFAEGKPLNAIDFVMTLNQCSFYQALQRINQDLGLKLTESNDVGTFEEGGSTDYWSQFEAGSTTVGTIALLLEKYEVVGVRRYVTEKGFTVTPNPENPAFAFKLGEGYTKIYRPLEQNPKFKHLYLGRKPKDYHSIFGLTQLPEHCPIILLVEGLKDCIVANTNLNDDGIYAVGLDNASTAIKPEILTQLRSKCDNLVLCLDTDKVGLEMSEKKSKQYGLRNFILPTVLNENGGKDISDWFRLKLDKHLLLKSLGEVLASPEPKAVTVSESETKISKSMLEILLDTEQLVAQRATQPIVYSPPLISRGEIPIIRRGTINVIQGKYGSHKSRLAEMFCSFLIANSTDCLHHYLQFDKTDEAITVVYIDTERNLTEEFPTAIQSIKQKGCYGINDTPTDFRFTSIKQVPRTKRLQAVQTFIEQVRTQTTYPMFVLLDVVTDCVSDFNNASESMQLYDYLGNLCDNYEATFLLVIHQNPNSEKARGHLGTEGANKASTVMQIGFEKGKNNEDSELINLKFLKTRSAKRPNPIPLIFDENQKGLVLAHEDLVNRITAERRQVADIELVTEELGKLLLPSLPQKELLQQLKPTFDCSDNTLKSRLDEIATQKIEITNGSGYPCILNIKTANGKSTLYELQEMECAVAVDL
jgi:hypothetical protein